MSWKNVTKKAQMSNEDEKTLLTLVRKAMQETGIDDRAIYVSGGVEEMQGLYLRSETTIAERRELAGERKPGGGDGAYGLMEQGTISEFVTELLTMFHASRVGEWLGSGKRDIGAHECRLDLDIQPCTPAGYDKD